MHRSLQDIMRDGRKLYGSLVDDPQTDMLAFDAGQSFIELVEAEYGVDLADEQQAVAVAAVLEQASRIAGEMGQVTGDEDAAVWAFHAQLAGVMRMLFWTHSEAHEGVSDEST